ncbi:hypothetical protein MK851_09250 [Tenacibaculum sp. 1B UA]|uniref:hypothetical protein n=1 Tax=Tenacibaculum sp. 1B UA TaxID=2922252 RepID=UPI002A24857B|nr:hypothetical protein [Tenacibaculum sp. 1B UA]MDX8553804.1 hypothetical protein [Tenacibaculum sp. 1B UA]
MKNKKTIPILGLLLHSAKGFYDLGFNCAYNLNKNNGISGFQRIPAGAVNMSFAAELFLKAIHLIVKNKSIKGHELLKLFKDLPQNTKTDIEKRFNYHLKNNNEAKLLPSHKLVVSVSDTKTNQDNSDNINLLEFLTKHNLTFQNWRYMHEVKDTGYSYVADFKTIDCFLKSLIDFINSNPKKTDLILNKN